MAGILTEWQQEHAERLGALLGHVENVLRAGALYQETLHPELLTALNGLAQAHSAYDEHASATIEATK